MFSLNGSQNIEPNLGRPANSQGSPVFRAMNNWNIKLRKPSERGQARGNECLHLIQQKIWLDKKISDLKVKLCCCPVLSFTTLIISTLFSKTRRKTSRKCVVNFTATSFVSSSGSNSQRHIELCIKVSYNISEAPLHK